MDSEGKLTTKCENKINKLTSEFEIDIAEVRDAIAKEKKKKKKVSKNENKTQGSKLSTKSKKR